MAERIILVAMYMVGMLAVSWVAWQFVPGVVVWMDATFGMWIVRGMMLAFIVFCFAFGIYWDRRHRSGRAFDP